MFVLALVAMGGALGSMSRYLINVWWSNMAKTYSLPMGTITVNLVGCFVIGLLSGLGETHKFLTPQTRGFFIVGLLGGFTTFSAFGNDTFILMRNGQFAWALLNIGIQVIIGLMAVAAGYAASRVF